tara:strand:+ start:122 stop:748 length:627 start_codon:yes stop_codon:yes gene_type:complete
MNKNILLSYPCSGNSYLRYLIEMSTKLPTIDVYNKKSIDAKKMIVQGVQGDPIIYKVHQIHHAKIEIDKLIFLHRHPDLNVYSVYRRWPHHFNNNPYANILNVYSSVDKWVENNNNKEHLFIDYETLINKSDETLKRAVHFLDKNLADTIDFNGVSDKVREISQNRYNNATKNNAPNNNLSRNEVMSKFIDNPTREKCIEKYNEYLQK